MKKKEEDTQEGESEKETEDKESHILSDFSACMYGYEDKAAFQEVFDLIRSKVHKQTWLDSIYKVKKMGRMLYERCLQFRSEKCTTK